MNDDRNGFATEKLVALRKLAKLFEEKVWYTGLQRRVEGDRRRYLIGTKDFGSVMVGTLAGCVVFSFRPAGVGDAVTFITVEGQEVDHERGCGPMGVQNCDLTVSEATHLVERFIKEFPTLTPFDGSFGL